MMVPIRIPFEVALTLPRLAASIVRRVEPLNPRIAFDVLLGWAVGDCDNHPDDCQCEMCRSPRNIWEGE
jgi:hypothetical protein